MRNFLVIIFAISIGFNSFASENKSLLVNIDADNPLIKYMGRVDRSNPKSVNFSWPGVAIIAVFEGTTCNIKMKDKCSGNDAYGNPHANYYNIIIDNKKPFVIKGDPLKEIYKIDTLSAGRHRIEIFKRTEGLVGETEFKGFQLQDGKKLLKVPNSTVLKIEFIGNSITCGYGNEGDSENCKFSGETENNYLAYGAITARNLNAEYSAVAFSGKGLYQNYDQGKEETMPDLYDRALTFDEDKKWNFKSWKPDIVVINLGTNDFAHVNPDSAIWVDKYLAFIKTIRSNYPNADIICSIGCMMSDYWPEKNKALTTISKYLNAVVSTANKNDKKVHLFFFTPHTGGYGCDWHPGLNTHQQMADKLTAFIKGGFKR